MTLRILGAAIAGALALCGGAANALTQQSDANAAHEASIDAVDQLVAQGIVLFIQGRYEEAWVPLESALALSERDLGEGPYTALVLTNLGLNYASAERFTDAEQVYTRALAIHDAIFEDDNRERLDLLLNVGQLYSNTARPAEALPFLERANAICSRQCAPDEERAAYTRNSLAKVYRDLGRYSEADALASPPANQRL